MKVFSGDKKLMYLLLFDEKSYYEIPFMEYISKIEDVDVFTNRIVSNLLTAGITIKEYRLIIKKNEKVWKLKIDRNLYVEEAE